jgi:hypothetical protein
MRRLDDDGGMAGRPAGEQRGDGRRGDGLRRAGRAVDGKGDGRRRRAHEQGNGWRAGHVAARAGAGAAAQGQTGNACAGGGTGAGELERHRG